MNIVTDYNYLCHRWQAWLDDDEELIGTGDTQQEAIDNLCDQLCLPYSLEAETTTEIDEHGCRIARSRIGGVEHIETRVA